MSLGLRHFAPGSVDAIPDGAATFDAAAAAAAIASALAEPCSAARDASPNAAAFAAIGLRRAEESSSSPPPLPLASSSFVAAPKPTSTSYGSFARTCASCARDDANASALRVPWAFFRSTFTIPPPMAQRVNSHAGIHSFGCTGAIGNCSDRVVASSIGRLSAARQTSEIQSHPPRCHRTSLFDAPLPHTLSAIRFPPVRPPRPHAPIGTTRIAPSSDRGG